MKTFVTSVLSAIVAGLVLFLAQGWWSNSQAASSQRIRFDETAVVSLSKADLTKLASRTNDYIQPVIHVVRATNNGTGDISDKSFSYPSETVISYGSIRDPNSNPNNARMSYDGKALTIRYRILPKEGSHTFWFATTALIGDVNFAADSTGVSVYSFSDRFNDEHPFPWIWFGWFAALLFAATIGFLVGDANASAELRKRGYDYKALTASQPQTKD